MNLTPRDPAALILGLMADGRERTANDISVRIRVPVDTIKPILREMARLNYLTSEAIARQGTTVIYRKPQP